MRYLLIGLLLLFFACTQEKKPLPLPEGQLIRVLIDVHVAEAALQNLRGATKDSVANVYYSQICTIHDIERAALDSSLAMLRKRPEQLYEIYTKAMEEVDRMAAENKAGGGEEKEKK